LQLRDYQSAAISKIHEAWIFHNSVMVEMATGLGKTVVFAEVAKRWNRGRVLVVAPLLQLIDQAAAKIHAVTGTMPAIEQGQRRSEEHTFYRSPFVVGSKQTLTGKSKRYQRLSEITLVIIDECHYAATAHYKEMLDWFVGNGAQVLGVTATAKRHDGRAMANLFEACPYQFGIADAIPEGWLVPAKVQCIQLESLDLSKVSTRGADGDFKESELAKVMEEEKVVYEIAAVTARESEGLKTAVFCASVREARAVAELLVDRYGRKAEWICADVQLCSPAHRQDVLRSFAGDPDGVQIVCNVGVLTTGWDFPGLEHIVVARPTRSLSLYTQIFGRGTRPLAGVVDFAGSTAELRRQAIAASAKPHFKVTDLRDNAMQHKLVTAVDVLGGKMGIEIVNRAKSQVNKAGGPIDLEAVLADAKRAEEAAREARERKRRAAIETRAQYKSVDVDPFDEFQRAPVDMKKPDQRGPRMLFGKHKGKLLSTIPTGYLRWLEENATLRGWLKNAVTTELQSRNEVKA
jgi:superfamily II DNA or RNA helicase